MTKKEIYEQVVRLTDELAQTKIPEKIFTAAAEKNASKVDIILSAFPQYYPELYERIVSFGEEFNKPVEESSEEFVWLSDIIQSFDLMCELAQTNVIGQIAEVANTEDASKLPEIINNFKHKYPYIAEELVKFQTEYCEFIDTNVTGYAGRIFGLVADVENDVFVFDTNVIDALSFYIFIILTNIPAISFFYYEEIEKNVKSYVHPAIDHFLDAIEKATNEAFAEFIENYDYANYIGKNKEFQTVGELLVAVLAGEF